MHIEQNSDVNRTALLEKAQTATWPPVQFRGHGGASMQLGGIQVWQWTVTVACQCVLVQLDEALDSMMQAPLAMPQFLLTDLAKHSQN